MFYIITYPRISDLKRYTIIYNYIQFTICMCKDILSTMHM